MNYQEDFKKTLTKYLEPLGHGAQTKLSQKTGISTNVICSIVKGRRTGSERTKNKIANALGYTYDEFLTFAAVLIPQRITLSPFAAAVTWIRSLPRP